MRFFSYYFWYISKFLINNCVYNYLLFLTYEWLPAMTEIWFFFLGKKLGWVEILWSAFAWKTVQTFNYPFSISNFGVIFHVLNGHKAMSMWCDWLIIWSKIQCKAICPFCLLVVFLFNYFGAYLNGSSNSGKVKQGHAAFINQKHKTI